MISDIPFFALIAALAALTGVFIVMRSIKLPASFDKNREKREALRREWAKSGEGAKGREKFAMTNENDDHAR